MQRCVTIDRFHHNFGEAKKQAKQRAKEGERKKWQQTFCFHWICIASFQLVTAFFVMCSKSHSPQRPKPMAYMRSERKQQQKKWAKREHREREAKQQQQNIHRDAL